MHAAVPKLKLEEICGVNRSSCLVETSTGYAIIQPEIAPWDGARAGGRADVSYGHAEHERRKGHAVFCRSGDYAVLADAEGDAVAVLHDAPYRCASCAGELKAQKSPR